MGAWGTGNFQNDTACDWVYALKGSDDLGFVWAAIEAVFREEYVDADVGAEALAAIEVVACLKGKAGQLNSYMTEFTAWVEAHKGLGLPENLQIRAGEAIDILAGQDSELNELWSESEDYGGWRSCLAALRERVLG